MKKNKNEPELNTELKSENDALNTGGEGLQFKKVLYGYDPQEVTAYIEQLSANYECSARLQETKLSSIKEELVLSNRERDALNEKYKAVQASLNKAGQQSEPVKEDKSAEYEAAIATLNAKLEKALRENESLKALEAKPDEDKTKILTARIYELEAENGRLAAELDGVKAEKKRLISEAGNYNSLFTEYSSLLSVLEGEKAKVKARDEELEARNEELTQINSRLIGTADENEKHKKLSAELEVKNSVLSKRVEEYEAEITALKDANKLQAFELNEKISTLESDHASHQLERQKEMKLHGCYIDRAQLTLEELIKQMEQIKQSLNALEEK